MKSDNKTYVCVNRRYAWKLSHKNLTYPRANNS